MLKSTLSNDLLLSNIFNIEFIQYTLRVYLKRRPLHLYEMKIIQVKNEIYIILTNTTATC